MKFSADYCPFAEKQSVANNLSPDEVLSFVQNYARVIRERAFNVGVCGEEILILVVRVVPTGLFWQSPTDDFISNNFYKPVSWISIEV